MKMKFYIPAALVFCLLFWGCPDEAVFVDSTVPAPGITYLNYPANGADNIPATVNFNWQTASNAVSYELQVSSVSTFSSPEYVASLSGNSKQLNLQNAYTYYWRVEAFNSIGQASVSSAWTFTTQGYPPSPPVLSSPDDNSTGQPITLALYWNTSTGAESYRLQVAGDASFSNIILDDSTLTITSKQLTNLSYNKTYYWRVRAKNGNGNSSFSGAYNFTTISSLTVPAAPVLSGPANSAAGQVINPTFSWNSSTGATAYKLQLSQNSSFSTLAFSDSNISGTSKQVSGLLNAVTYYWRVYARNSAGWSAASDIWSFTTSPATSIELISITGGTFLMGDVFGDGNANESPVHSIQLNGFKISKTEVTQQQWIDITGTNPSNTPGANKPVESISWYDVIDYCNKLSLREGLTPCYSIGGNINPYSWTLGTITFNTSANGYRLPTEAEWEYAARGGGMNIKYAGTNTDADVPNFAWYQFNSGNHTNNVAGRQPNSLGIFDMSGNVQEWCWDWYSNYGSAAQQNPVGPASGTARVVRSDAYNSPLSNMRNSLRNNFSPGNISNNLGFRIARN